MVRDSDVGELQDRDQVAIFNVVPEGLEGHPDNVELPADQTQGGLPSTRIARDIRYVEPEQVRRHAGRYEPRTAYIRQPEENWLITRAGQQILNCTVRRSGIRDPHGGVNGDPPDKSEVIRRV